MVIRKMALCILVISCIIFGFGVIAEEENGIDLASMSLDELLQLRNLVEDEIIEKGGGDYVFLPSGNYVAGKDIGVGRYTLRCHQLGDNGYVEITVYAAGVTPELYDAARREATLKAEEYQNAIDAGREAEMPEVFDKSKYVVFDGNTCWNNEEISVSLDEGQVLVVNVAYERVVTIEPSKGLFMD